MFHSSQSIFGCCIDDGDDDNDDGDDDNDDEKWLDVCQ